MAQPVLVTAYNSVKASSSERERGKSKALPPVSAYAFADILQSVDSPEVQAAIHGIAEICAKNRMSLAEEYASHLPPVGEITQASSSATKSISQRPGMRRPLTSVPEASSTSSEGSRKSRRRSIFGFGRQSVATNVYTRNIRIAAMGRSISISGTTAMATEPVEDETVATSLTQATQLRPAGMQSCAVPSAMLSLRRLLISQQSDAG